MYHAYDDTTYNRIQRHLAEAQALIEFEKENCSTHSQRNAAMHLIRLSLELVRDALRYERSIPDSKITDTDDLPF